MIIQGVYYASDFEAKKAMGETAKAMAAKNMMIATDGSLSVRVGPNAVWITVRDADKSALSQADFVRVDLNGKQMLSAKQVPLPEDLQAHLKLYATDPAIQCVVHAYPMEAALLGLSGIMELPAAAYTPAVRSLGRVSRLKGGESNALAEAASLAAKTDKAALYGSDGILVWGANAAEAYRNLQAFVYRASIALRAATPVAVSCPPGEAAYAAPLPATVPGSSYSPAPAPVYAQNPGNGGQIPNLTPLVKPAGSGENTAKSGYAPSLQAQAMPSSVYITEPAIPTPKVVLSQPMIQETKMPAPTKPLENSPREDVMAEVVRRARNKMN